MENMGNLIKPFGPPVSKEGADAQVHSTFLEIFKQESTTIRKT